MKCEGCRHWHNPATNEFGSTWGECRGVARGSEQPGMLIDLTKTWVGKQPQEIDTPAVVWETWQSECGLFTRADFGCVLHQPVAVSDA